MSNVKKLISLDRIFSKIYRDLKISNLSETDVVEWAAEAIEAIGGISIYNEEVAFIEVKNHQATLPLGIHSIIQIARNNNFKGPSKELCPKVIQQELGDCSINSGCGSYLEDHDYVEYLPYYSLDKEFYGWFNSGRYESSYTPVRLADSSFFNSIVCQLDETYYTNSKIYTTLQDEYTVVNGTTLRFSFKEGYISLAYLRQPIDDETGYPMIIDDYSYTTAVEKYILMKIMEREFYAGRDNSASRLDRASSDWQWYCRQASNGQMMLQGIDEHQNFLDQRSYILPNNKKYFGFFGNLSYPENRKFLNPDNRSFTNRFNF